MNAEPERPEKGSFACMRAEHAVAFVNGELSPADRTEFERHCEDCEECRLLIRQFREVAALLEERPRYEPDEGLADRVLSLIRSEKEAPAWSRVVAFPAWRFDYRWVAAACLMLLGGVSLLVWLIVAGSDPSGMQSRQRVAVSVPAGSSAEAVCQALDWLACAQEKSGAWDPVKWKGEKEYEIALTGMALLTFLRQPDAAVRAHYSNVVALAAD
jgi:anti-sigma factor RsiW